MKTEITNLQILSELAPALAELKTMKLPGSVTIAAVRAFNECQKKAQEYEDARMAILKAHCAKDEEGKPKIKDNQYEFDNEEAKKNVEAEIKKVAEGIVSIDITAVDSKVFERIEITGNLYEVLARYGFINDSVMIKKAQAVLEKVFPAEEPTVEQAN
jgi:hypothetical protein